jgi:putative FmdB family regulatory protein
MPIYEYECCGCEGQFQALVMKNEEEKDLVCPGCGSRKLKRLISRVAYHTSEQDRLDAYDPKAPKGDSFYRDSRNIGLHAKKRAQQMGVDLGSSFESKLEKLRSDPGSVLKDSE